MIEWQTDLLCLLQKYILLLLLFAVGVLFLKTQWLLAMATATGKITRRAGTKISLLVTSQRGSITNPRTFPFLLLNEK